MVYPYAPSDDPRDLAPVTDNVGAGRLAVEHLASCRRRRIAHITGDPDYQAATRMLLDAEPDVDAIFAGSDQIARGCSTRCTRPDGTCRPTSP